MTSRRLRVAARSSLLLFSAVACLAATAEAQVFQLEGGSASVSRAVGGRLNVWGNDFDGSIGIGYMDGLVVGAFARRQVGRDTLRIGNDVITLHFPTDLFGAPDNALVQGVGVHRVRQGLNVVAFAGAMASGVPAPFFSSSRPEKAVGVLQAEYRVSPTVHLYSHTVVSDRQTMVEGIQWRPSSSLSAALSAGVGSNQPYAATSASFKRDWLDVKASYVQIGNNFRRSTVRLQTQSEVEKENVLVTLRPHGSLMLSVGRQHFRQDSVTTLGTGASATLNQAFASAQMFGLNVAGGVFDSRSAGMRNISSYLSAGRDLTRRVQSDLYVLRTWEPTDARSTNAVLYLREFVTPRLNLLQVVTRSNSHTAVSFGGNVITPLGSLGVDYQIVHTPYRVRDPFVQTLGLNAKLQLGKYQLNIGSFVTPDGRVHYAASGSTFLYRGLSSGPTAQSIETHFDRFVVEGRVTDDAGRPVEGAAVDLSGEMTFTNSQGRFFLRRGNTRPMPVKVPVEEFLSAGSYEVVSAPQSVTPTAESKARPVEIVVRRAAHAQPAPPSRPDSIVRAQAQERRASPAASPPVTDSNAAPRASSERPEISPARAIDLPASVTATPAATPAPGKTEKATTAPAVRRRAARRADTVAKPPRVRSPRASIRRPARGEMSAKERVCTDGQRLPAASIWDMAAPQSKRPRIPEAAAWSSWLRGVPISSRPGGW